MNLKKKKKKKKMDATVHPFFEIGHTGICIVYLNPKNNTFATVQFTKEKHF